LAAQGILTKLKSFRARPLERTIPRGSALRPIELRREVPVFET
jgi:hypothetical protein